MLENQDPFYSMLKVLKFYGVWKSHLLKRRHRIIATACFIIFQPLAFAFLFAQLWKINTVGDYARTIGALTSVLMASSYIGGFFLCNEKIQELFDDFNKTFNENPQCLQFINQACIRAKKVEVKKFSLIAVYMIFPTFALLVTHKGTMPLYEIESLKDYSIYYYIKLTYEFIYMFYFGIFSMVIQDFYYTLLKIVSAYNKFCQSELKKLDLCGNESKKNLIHCVKIHQNAKRLLRKFVKVAHFPIGNHMLLGTYIVCNTVFHATLDTDDKNLGSLLGFAVISMLQLLIPCMSSQEIENASRNFVNDVAEGNWIDANIEAKKLMVFFMQNLAHPTMRFNLYGIIDVNLTTFLNILNMAYSIYAVLNSQQK